MINCRVHKQYFHHHPLYFLVLLIVCFACGKSKRYISWTPSHKSGQYRNKANSAPPATEINSRQDDDDPRDNPDHSICFSNIAFHAIYFLPFSFGSSRVILNILTLETMFLLRLTSRLFSCSHEKYSEFGWLSIR